MWQWHLLPSCDSQKYLQTLPSDSYWTKITPSWELLPSGAQNKAESPYSEDIRDRWEIVRWQEVPLLLMERHNRACKWGLCSREEGKKGKEPWPESSESNIYGDWLWPRTTHIIWWCYSSFPENCGSLVRSLNYLLGPTFHDLGLPLYPFMYILLKAIQNCLSIDLPSSPLISTL